MHTDCYPVYIAFLYLIIMIVSSPSIPANHVNYVIRQGKEHQLADKEESQISLTSAVLSKNFHIPSFPLVPFAPFFYFCRFQSPHVLLNTLLHVFKFYWHLSKYIHVILFTELNRTFYWNIKHTWPIVLTQILRGKEMKKRYQ